MFLVLTHTHRTGSSTCHSLALKMRQLRITKSEAARRLVISRRTVIRFAQLGKITVDRRGRVLLSEVAKAWARPSSKGARWMQRARRHRPVVLWRGSYWSPARLVKHPEWLVESEVGDHVAYLKRYAQKEYPRAHLAYLKEVEDSLFIDGIKPPLHSAPIH